MFLFKNLKKQVMKSSRSKKLDHFYSLCDPNSRILDVGVSNSEINDQANLFLKNFRFDSKQYTGLAVQPMDDTRKKYPGKVFVEYPGGVFPFKDNEFDWVFSNAVIEHVGSKKEQLLFLNEMLRVGRNVFLTTPNKYFPVDSHTNSILRHWFNDSFHEWCKKNRPYWTSDANLLLLGIGDLNNLLNSSNADNILIKKNRTLGWTMTFTVVCSSENG